MPLLCFSVCVATRVWLLLYDHSASIELENSQNLPQSVFLPLVCFQMSFDMSSPHRKAKLGKMRGTMQEM